LAGHYSAAFAAKGAAPRVPFWILLLAAQFVDILWVIFVATGVEHARVVATLPSNPLDLYDMPYSHSLLATAFWSGAAFLGARLALGLDRRAAGAVSLVVASHWFLDLLVHRPDLSLAFSETRVGFGLWNHPVAAYVLEVLFITASASLCIHSLGSAGRARRSWLGLALGLVLVQTAASFGPLPSSLPGLMIPAFAAYVSIPWIGARIERGAPRVTA
jgi:hypothetical protein